MNKSLIFSYVVSGMAIIVAVFGLISNKGTNNVVNKLEDIEFTAQDGYLKWKYKDEKSWQELYDLSYLKGADGTDGKDGINGIDGKNGADGKDGINGIDGKDGINGIDGKDGKNGTDGRNGIDGREIELSVVNDAIVWRYVGENNWKNLISLEDLVKRDGPSELIVSVNGNSSDFGCVSSKETCDFGTAMEIKVSSTEINEFYVVNDDNVNLTLVASKNIGNSNTTTLPWYNSSTSKGNNTKGPLNVLTTLNTLTNNWTNIDYIKNYEYNNSGTGYKKLSIVEGNAIITDSSGGNVEVSGKARARLLTYEEARALGCSTSSGSCPSWLYKNLNAEYNSLTPYGYWLLTSYGDGRAYNVRNTGLIANNSTSDSTGRGIRPVITIKKYAS